MKRTFFLLAVIIWLPISLFGQAIPKQISYQGVLKDAGGNVLTGDFAMTFKLYNEATGGTALWTEILPVEVTNGLFSVQLGSITPITTVPFDRIHFLGITVGSESELTPRTLLSPSPYSFMAMNVKDEAVTTSKLMDGAVTSSKIGSNEVVKSLNGLKDSVTLVAGSNITLTPSGNDITIEAATGGGGTIGGSGTADYIPKFSNSTTLQNSVLFQTNGRIGIGTTIPSLETKLHINASSDNFGVLVAAQGTSGSEIGLHSASSKYASIAKNAFFSSGNWNRFDISSGSFLQEIFPSGIVEFKIAEAGSNPILWNKVLTIGNSGKGVSARSDTNNGVEGWTASSGHSGVLGYTTSGKGVTGRSEQGDGVVGWTGAADKSGVYGYSTSGIGITGRSDQKDGILGVTTSASADNAGVHARNEGNGPAIYSEGNLYVTGKYYGNIGGNSMGAPFPRPAFDSGWITATAGASFTLGVNLYLPTSDYDNDNFVIDLMTKGGYTHKAGNYGIGGRYDGGYVWYSIGTDNSIVVSVSDDADDAIEAVRIRVWYIK